MRRFIVLDTETTGLFDFKLPADAPTQPRLAELAAILCDEDPDAPGVEHRFLVRPDGWEMTPEATGINGLTTEYLNEVGVDLSQVLAFYALCVSEGRIVIAHNAQYDTKVLRGEFRRLGMPDLFEATPNICTMRGAMPVCRVMNASGKGIKLPKLDEAYKHFAGEEMPLISDGKAMRDARGCRRVFYGLLAGGALPDAAVHYAKNRPVAATADESPATSAPVVEQAA